MRERLQFARDAITWNRERLYRQIFTDEVWAMGGAHTVSYVTVKTDNTDRHNIDNVTWKYSKAPAWMFWGSIVDGRKGPAIFWDKEWGKMKSSTYDIHILSMIEEFMHENLEKGYIFMQDNAPCHRSRETQQNLQIRNITSIHWPRYSPDLNLIEHVWNWMKTWIQDHYWQACYDVAKVPLQELQRIILEAWNAVPESYIEHLLESWWRRCQAVIDTEGGPTKY